MQPTNRSSRILLPVKLWFVYLSLFAALGLEYIPTGRTPGLPDWVALVLAFWCVREPLRIGMGVGFVFGLLVDVGLGAAMGQHALAYVVLAYLANTLARRVLWFPSWQQALHVLPLLLLAQLLMMAVRLLAGGEFPGWSYFLSSFSSALLWAPLSFLLLLPQYQPVERDDNRPI
ncbi:rod shape-determining protein MreD [Thauera mechernichensis]|uniref:Rod shape-determining protein MreD n=1 Tax=Thauera mechernichensis TaxID=82788 RepID=A0ABW3W8Y3_9RHOO|nr:MULTISPECIES: rod shape-determining protein MreD [Thauera]ENO81957.1 rod shape-determining protein MreD [Thauera sp. 27]ENO94191.1 rod shape-determining protein MreD [Thauera sp. 28]MDG3066722.1 rod shape-determining protein MreD [Thauera mechernichensis]WBL64478.1 rod shape-determining protein MreD [Thauera sp. WB-2]HAG73961.1 rod shape-determining protein MreD [Thauera sp.]